VRELISRKQIKEMVMRYLENNPKESLRSVADRFGVSKDTVMRLKGKVLVSNETKNSQKKADNVSNETPKPAVFSAVSASKIEKQMLTLIEKITEMEEVANQLSQLHGFQIVDGLEEQGSSILPNLDIWAEILDKTVRVYQGVLNERTNY
jgi:predicted DNA-binding protein YlxM (UPF0122 family)